MNLLRQKFFLIPLACLIVFFTIVFWPIITNEYLWHDDFRSLAWNLDSTRCSDHPLYNYLVYSQARPFGAYLVCMVHSQIQGIPDGSFIRVCLVLLLGVTAWLFFVPLRGFLKSNTQTLLLAAGTFVLPGYVTTVAYISNCVGLFSVTIALCSSLLLFGELRNSSHSIWRFVLPGILFLLAIMIYQSSAMIVWSVLLSYVALGFDEHNHEFKKKLFKISAYLMGLMALYYLFARFLITKQFGIIKADAHIWSGLSWFYETPLLNVANLGNIFPHTRWRTLFLVFFALASGLYLLRKKSHKQRFEALQKILTMVGLLLLSYAPYILSSMKTATYRSQLALEASFVIMCYWIATVFVSFIKKYFSQQLVLNSLLVVFVIGTAFTGRQNAVKYIVNHASQEIGFVRENLRQTSNKTNSHISFITPTMEIVDKLPSRYDEFGFPITTSPEDAHGLLIGIISEYSPIRSFTLTDRFNFEINGMVFRNLQGTENATALQTGRSDVVIDLVSYFKLQSNL